MALGNTRDAAADRLRRYPSSQPRLAKALPVPAAASTFHMPRKIIPIACLIVVWVGFAVADTPISIVSEPSTICSNYREDHKSGHIIVSTTAPGGLPALYLRATGALKSSETFASIGFPGNGGRNSIEIPAKPVQ